MRKNIDHDCWVLYKEAGGQNNDADTGEDEKNNVAKVGCGKD